MKSSKNTARIIGVLLIVVMITYYIGEVLIGSVLNATDYLSNVFPNKVKV